MLAIVEDNQADSQVGEAGELAFQMYYMSGFTDLAKVQAAADSFQQSNDKDRISLGRIDQLDRPDQRSANIAEALRRGIISMDQGNTVFLDSSSTVDFSNSQLEVHNSPSEKGRGIRFGFPG